MHFFFFFDKSTLITQIQGHHITLPYLSGKTLGTADYTERDIPDQRQRLIWVFTIGIDTSPFLKFWFILF